MDKKSLIRFLDKSFVRNTTLNKRSYTVLNNFRFLGFEKN